MSRKSALDDPENNISSPISPSTHRPSTARFRLRRAGTILASTDYQDEAPGQEPGLDPNETSDSRVNLHTVCGITVVDFSEDDIVQNEFENVGLISFLNMPRADWVRVRWINCNGLSWDVIQALAKYRNLHRLGELLFSPGFSDVVGRLWMLSVCSYRGPDESQEPDEMRLVRTLLVSSWYLGYC